MFFSVANSWENFPARGEIFWPPGKKGRTITWALRNLIMIRTNFLAPSIHCTENLMYVFQEMKHMNDKWNHIQRYLIKYLNSKLTSYHSFILLYHTAKTKCRKFETNIPRKGIWGPQSQFPHSCICERIIYSHDGSAFSAGGNMWKVDRSWEYINRSQTHECGNWGWGRAIPRKGIYNRNCSCSAERTQSSS